MEIKQREWGKTEITGGRHGFRIGLLQREMLGLVAPVDDQAVRRGSVTAVAGAAAGGTNAVQGRKP